MSARMVTCPRCQAQPRDACTSTSGRPAYDHAKRQRRALDVALHAAQPGRTT